MHDLDLLRSRRRKSRRSYSAVFSSFNFSYAAIKRRKSNLVYIAGVSVGFLEFLADKTRLLLKLNNVIAGRRRQYYR